MTRAIILVLLTLGKTAAVSLVDQVSMSAMQVLNQATVPGAQIRQCSCQEESVCVVNMQRQAWDCSGQCWGVCVNSPTGQPIPMHDIRRIFDLGEQKILQSRFELFNSAIIKQARPLAETVLNFGSCVKRCFVYQKNANGFCFDQSRCQPLIVQNKLRFALRVCLRSLNWKQHVGDLCTCAQNAGVNFFLYHFNSNLLHFSGLQNVCSLLHMLG
uniref:DB domain-containing protein n=1 Tax=Heterorhabditis bacteriophora TaxID=37862 RepID=A0A1I7XE60_HETBA